MRVPALALSAFLGAATIIAVVPARAQAPARQAPAAAPAVPPLKIVLPRDGAEVGTQLALVFATPGDMSKLTMSAPVVGVHLHVAVDDTVLMPAQQQLIRLGGQRYLFVFDLPVKPGPHRISAFWADPAHDTIESSVRTVRVRVTPDPAP
ncbi:MAG: hypothetical protein ISP90_07305 [Nevskia sp.]|nr:hypothetical protein [Nevskia sp.]